MIYLFFKRVIDIIGALIGLFLLFLFLPFITLAIKLNSRGPVFIRIERVSRGKVIKVFKFRSMVKDAQALKESLRDKNERKDGPFFKIKNDPRVTKIGRFLRKFKIDEFPQLINVLKGEMTLVGPRPHEPSEVIHYPGEYKFLIMEKAGVSGLSQVSGASNLLFLKELELDAFYIRHRSIWFDSKIILKSILLLFDPSGV